MRDQEIDFACMTEEGEQLLPLTLRYGVTAAEATHREPLELALSQEEAEQEIGEEGVWDEVEQSRPAVARSHVVPFEELEEEQVSVPAEQDAVHAV